LSKELIAKLVEMLRAVDGWQNARTDYGFIGKLLNEHGEAPVRRALMTLERVARLYPPEGLRGLFISLIQEAKEQLEIQETAKRQREFLKKKTQLQFRRLNERC